MGIFVASTDTMGSLTAAGCKSDQRWGKNDHSERDGIRVNNDSGKTVFVKENLRRGSLLVIPRRCQRRNIKKREMGHTLTTLKVFVEDMAGLRVLTIFFNHYARATYNLASVSIAVNLA
jgi:hypothetical protein